MYPPPASVQLTNPARCCRSPPCTLPTPWFPAHPRNSHTLASSTPWHPPHPGTHHTRAPSTPSTPSVVDTLPPAKPSQQRHPIQAPSSYLSPGTLRPATSAPALYPSPCPKPDTIHPS
eukprot:361195-Chlamydomonas_euryale.AAC.3